MKGYHQPSPSEASTVDDEIGSWSSGGSSSVCSADDVDAHTDVSEGDNQSLDIPPRGWSMRRGHMKKVAKLKTGKSALWAEIQGQGQEVSKGRAAFARSVNGTCRHWDCIWGESKAAKRHGWQNDIRCDTLDYVEEAWSWEACATYNYDEEGSEWAPIDSYMRIEVQPCLTSKPVSIFVDKISDLDKLARQLKPCGAILEKESFGKGGFSDLQKQLLAKHGPTFCAELSKSVNRTIHVTPAPVSADIQRRFLEARTTLSGSLSPGYHGTNISSLSSIYQNGLVIPGKGNDIRVANGSAHGVGIYTAKVSNPQLSWSFCRAPSLMERRMMVCGILDDAPQQMGSQSYKMGIRTVSRESKHVRHVGDAMVIFDDRRVAPFFEVTIGEVLGDTQINTKVPPFDWARWQETINRILNAFPAKKLTHRAPLLRQKVKQQTAISYLTRRSASKRNPKIV